MWGFTTHTLQRTDGSGLEIFIELNLLLELAIELQSLGNADSPEAIGLKGRLNTSVLRPLFQSLCYPKPQF
jgi:hypothetical protein